MPHLRCQLISIHVRQCKDTPAGVVLLCSVLQHPVQVQQCTSAGQVLPVIAIYWQEKRKRRIVLSVSSPLRDSGTQFTVTDWKRCNQTVQHNGMHPFHFCDCEDEKKEKRDTWSKERKGRQEKESSQVSPIRITGKCVTFVVV